MNLWIWAALVAVILAGISSTAMKRIATMFSNNYAGLVWQYVSMVFFAWLYLLIISWITWWALLPHLSLFSLLILTVVWIAGFIGIALLFEAFDFLNVGICLIIANLSVFLMYFANIVIFEWSESLALRQLFLWLLFFIIVAQFLWTQSSCSTVPDAHCINKKALLPLGTALCWTVFFVGNTWFVKTAIMTPVQSVFFSESAVALVAFVWFFVHYKAWHKDLMISWYWSSIGVLALMWVCNVWANFLFYYGYQDNPANVINFIRLFYIITTAFFGRWFLHDKLSRKQLYLMLTAFAILVVFVLW